MEREEEIKKIRMIRNEIKDENEKKSGESRRINKGRWRKNERGGKMCSIVGR